MSPEALNQVIRELRERKGWSQRDLAIKARVTAAYIAMLETGAKKNPSAAVARRLERALGVRYGSLDTRTRLPREWWRPEEDRDLDRPTTLPPGPLFATREEAEREARAKGWRFVARYQEKPGEVVRRPLPVREQA